MDVQVILDAIPEIITQLIAFLLVFFILKKYAFGAVFNILGERQEAIASDLKSAENTRLEMEVLKKDYETRIREIEQEAREKIQHSIDEGTRIAQEIREKARNDAQTQLERAKRDVQIETDKARATLRNQIVDLSSRMTEKIIGKKFSQAENDQYIDEILKEAGK